MMVLFAAIAVAWSRLYLGVHFPIDMAASAVVALACAFVAARLVRPVERWLTRMVRRSVDPAIYRQRNLIERFFCKLKQFRRVATRFDKLARNFLAAIHIASTRLWLRAYESTP
jgi:transposase